VDVKGTRTEVLGTHFNINSYGDEHPVVTTLLEGRIKVSISQGQNSSAVSGINVNLKRQTSNFKLLAPGQQATITSGSKIIVKDHADTESAVAWMKGFFDFHNADIKNVMKQVSRWYNVDIQYTGVIPAQAFEGNIDRNIPLSELLSTLQQMGSGITYKVEGRTVRVVSR
jgi:ferric-dicitrate binding protein FerR (iron transport regulator)